MPWQPWTTRQWHPHLVASLRERMLEQDIFDQTELDTKYFVAATVRILADEHRVTALGPTHEQWQQHKRRQLLTGILEQLQDRLGMAVPRFAHRGTQYRTPETLTDEQREGLETVAMLQSGRTAAVATGEQQWQEWYQGQASSSGAASSAAAASSSWWQGSSQGANDPPWDWHGTREEWHERVDDCQEAHDQWRREAYGSTDDLELEEKKRKGQGRQSRR